MQHTNVHRRDSKHRQAILLASVMMLIAGSATTSAQSQPPSAPATTTAAPIAPSAPAATADLSSELASIITKHITPALGAAAFDSQGVRAIGVAGVRRMGHASPVTLGDRWHIGSCGKAITATLAAKLVREGVIGYDSTLGAILARPGPDGSKPIDVPERWKERTLGNLLACAAGVPSDVEPSLWNEIWRIHGDGVTPAEQRRVLAEGTLRAGPASSLEKPAFAYSNASLMLSGVMLEHATQQTFEALVQQHLNGALGLSTIGFGAPASGPGLNVAQERSEPSQPWGHSRMGVPVPPWDVASDNPPAMAPAGTMHLTLADWAAFGRLHLAASRGESVSPSWLPADAIVALHETIAPGADYARGWIVTKRPQWAKGSKEGDSGRVLTHTGSNTMSLAQIWLAPELDRGYIVVTNGAGPGAMEAMNAAVMLMINRDREARGEKPLKAD